MAIDPWKVSSIVLGSVFTLLVVGHCVDDAAAQPKRVGAPQKVEAPKEVKEVKEGEKTPSFDNDKKGTPMERAIKVLEHAKRTLTKVKPDEGGHRNNALKHIDTAIGEARSIPKVD